MTRPYSVYGTTEFADGELLMAAKQKGYYYVLVTRDGYKTDLARTRVTVRNPDVARSELGYGLIFHSDKSAGKGLRLFHRLIPSEGGFVSCGMNRTTRSRCDRGQARS